MGGPLLRQALNSTGSAYQLLPAPAPQSWSLRELALPWPPATRQLRRSRPCRSAGDATDLWSLKPARSRRRPRPRPPQSLPSEVLALAPVWPWRWLLLVAARAQTPLSQTAWQSRSAAEKALLRHLRRPSAWGQLQSDWDSKWKVRAGGPPVPSEASASPHGRSGGQSAPDRPFPAQRARRLAPGVLCLPSCAFYRSLVNSQHRGKPERPGGVPIANGRPPT